MIFFNFLPQLDKNRPFEPKKKLTNFEKLHSIFIKILFSIMLKTLQGILKADHELHDCIMLGHNQAKIAHLTQRRFLGKFRFCNFYLLTVPYHAAKYENNH